MNPTPEQEQALKLFIGGQSLKINAYAGTGKTSTLVMLSNADQRKGLYLAFNSAIVKDAKEKFGSKTTCMTIHSLALKSLPSKLRRKAFKSTNAAALVEKLELKDQIFEGNVLLTAKTLAFLVIQTIKEFCQGIDESIKSVNFLRYGKLSGLNDNDKIVVSDQIKLLAVAVWDRMKSAEHMDIGLGHDGYLKLWALYNPKLNFDYVLLDEAQDTNPVVLGVLQKQLCQIVYVGDAFQQIYEWRGAINAMEEFESTNAIYLTKSFRFGNTIADAASSVLRFLGAKKQMFGNQKTISRIGACEPDAILARTNSTVMSEVIAAINAGKKCHIIGGTKELLRMLNAVNDLKNGKPSDVPEFFGFTNWSDVEQLVDDGEADGLMTLVNLVRAHGEKHLMWALRRTEAQENAADVVISTVFKAKGREWDNVRLTDDFLPSIGDTKDGVIDPSEARVFYVALTRGKIAVDVEDRIIQFFTLSTCPPVNVDDTVGDTYQKIEVAKDKPKVADLTKEKQASLPLEILPKVTKKIEKTIKKMKLPSTSKQAAINNILMKLGL